MNTVYVCRYQCWIKRADQWDDCRRAQPKTWNVCTRYLQGSGAPEPYSGTDMYYMYKFLSSTIELFINIWLLSLWKCIPTIFSKINIIDGMKLYIIYKPLRGIVKSIIYSISFFLSTCHIYVYVYKKIVHIMYQQQ